VFVLFFGEDHWDNSTTTRKFGPKFNACIDVVYERVKLTRSETINWSIYVALGKDTKKPNAFILLQEKIMLTQSKCQLNIPLKVWIFCTKNVVIRRVTKLRKVNGFDVFSPLSLNVSLDLCGGDSSSTLHATQKQIAH
jgi:hypothetical protein